MRSRKLIEALATFVKFEADGWATNFFEAAYEEAWEEWNTTPKWRWRRRDRAFWRMECMLFLMSAAIHHGKDREGASECVAVIETMERQLEDWRR